MKKTISLLLCFALLLGSLCISSFASNKNTRGFCAYVATDIHHSVVDSVPVVDGKKVYYDNLGLTPTLAPMLLDELLLQTSRSDADYLFLTGDLADIPDKAQAKAVAKKLVQFEKSSGKTVFVINGNHDIDHERVNSDGMTRKAFKKIYKNLGYSEALCVDSATCSYTAELKNGWRLLAIDALDIPGDGGATITPALERWIRTQADKAKKDGKRLVALMHHPLMEHFTLMKKLLPIFVVSNSEQACRLFDECGIETVFTGHFHQNDIAVYHGSGDVYDIETTSLSCYPNAYRAVRFSEDRLKISTIPIEKIDTSKLPKGYTKAQRKQIESDLSGYAYDCLKKDSVSKVHSYLSAQKVGGMLGISNPALLRVLDRFLSAVAKDFERPLYGKGETIERFARRAGLILPKTDYATLDDAAAAFIAAVLSGDENFDTSSPLFRVALIGAVAILHHELLKTPDPLALTSALTKGYDACIDAVQTSAPLKAFLRFEETVRARLGTEPLPDLLLNRLEPLFVGLTMDKAPADSNVSLTLAG